MIESYMNWSGGKDSSLSLYKALQSGKYNIRYLVTSINSFHNRISMHGVRRELLQAQATSIGIPLQTIELAEQPGMQEYESSMRNKVNKLKKEGCTHAIFGDIFLEDLKQYREQNLQQSGIACVFPLWKIDTAELMKEFITSGFKAIVVCVNEKFLDKHFCGRLIDEAFVNDLPPNVDICGENGEYHSFVFDGPVFQTPIPFQKGDIVYRQYDAPKEKDHNLQSASTYGFYFCDLLPVADNCSL